MPDCTGLRSIPNPVRIALIKTSSMGDVIHAMPVVSDILRVRPDAIIDWVVEESFADLPRLHPGVAGVIPVALRRWRRSPWRRQTRQAVGDARRLLSEHTYDLVLDLQGLMKSAWLVRQMRGPSAGFGFDSVRERAAALVYARRYTVARELPAIDRLRSLAAQALGYTVEGPPVFDLHAPDAPGGPPVDGVLLHATAREEKRWPDDRWHALIEALGARGVTMVLPWGGDVEHEAAVRLAAIAPGQARVATRMTMAECARLLAGARFAVGVDTGLTHLAAALGTPTVAIFGATEAARYGPTWSARAVSLGNPGRWPSPVQVIEALQSLGVMPRSP